MLWRPRSLRIRYTLRALFVFITLFMLWGGYHANRGWKERQAIAILQERYAAIHEQRWVWIDPREWYRNLVGTLWGDRCVKQVLMNAELTSEEAEALAALPSLEQLTLDSSLRKGPETPTYEDSQPVALPPGALPRILAARSIRILYLEGCILSDDDLRAIGNEESLTTLLVTGATVDDRGLSSILSLPHLESLSIYGSSATGKGLATHPGSESLTSFRSTETPLGKEFAAFIAKCPNLREAGFSGANASIEFTRRLENHPSLEGLGFARSGLTEASIDSLLTIPSLTRLALPQRILTPEVQARIAKQRPDVIVRPISQ